MNRLIPVLAASVLVMAVALAAQTSPSPESLLKAALQREQIDGNDPDALAQYGRIVEQFPKHAAALRALQQMAGIHERHGDSSSALDIYGRIAREYANSEAGRVAAAKVKEASAVPTASGRLTQSTPTAFAPLPIDSRVPRGSIPSPDGQMVLVSAAGTFSITDLRTGTRQVLPGTEGTQSGRFVEGIWSADGRRIAFGRAGDGATKTVEIRTVTIKTGEVLTVATRPSFRGPMNFVAWTTRDEIVYRPDGEPVVFVPVTGGATTEIEMPESTPFRGGVDVLPDGSALLVAAGERLIRLDRATRREQILTRGFPVSDPRVSADGRLVAYISSESGQSALRVAPLTADEILRSVEIAKMPAGRNRETRWTADGRLTTEAGIATDNIYGMRLDDSRPNRRLVRLVHSSSFASVPTISPDDRQIVFHGSGSLNVMNADGSGERPLGVSAVPVAWLSADEVVIWTDNEGLRAVSLRTGTIRSIGFDGPLKADAASVALASDTFQYMPVSSQLMIRRLTPDRALFLSRRSGGDERLSFELPRVLSWRMSPQGDRIAYVTGGSSTQPYLLHLKAIGGDGSTVVGEVQRPGSERWTGDGRQLVYMASTPKSPVEFRRYDVRTGETAVLLNSSHLEAVFAPDISWNLGTCQLATNLTFLVCQSLETTVQRLGWTGVTFEAVMARLGTR